MKACIALAFALYTFLGCSLIACGGRTFVAGDVDLLVLDAGELAPADASREASPATSSALHLEDASSPATSPDASDAASAPAFGPTCMFGTCPELAEYGMRFTCGTWCCNRDDACDAPATSLCSAGACGLGNSNTTCGTADFVLCCAPSPGCP